MGVAREAHAGGGVDAVTVQVTGSALSNMTSSPLAISPSFTVTTTDYGLRCRPGINTIQLTLSAVESQTITIGGRTGSSVTLQESLIENQALIVSAPDPNQPRGSSTQYWIRCLPHDFPQLSVTETQTPPPGWYLTGNLGSAGGSGTYAFVLDNHGTPVWYQASNGSGFNTTSISQNEIAWSPNGTFEIFDLATEVGRWLPAPIAPTDPHELHLMSNGDVMMLANPRVPGVDLSGLGFSSSATIIDCVVEEVDSNGNLVWQWRASEHVSVEESTHPFQTTDLSGQRVYDLFHCNSVDTDPVSGDVLLSSRHTDAIYLIDKITGKIIWKLGGNSPNHDSAQILTITGDPDGAFHAQHDARFQPNSGVSLFDNQTWDHALGARGAEYRIDTGGGTATLVWSYPAADGHNSGATGSFRRLNGGSDNIIGWGVKGDSLFTEVDAAGSVMLDAKFPNGEHAYRVIKVAPTALEHDLLRATAGLAPFSFTRDTDPVITASGTTLAAAEALGLTDTVATFGDPDPTSTASDYLATVAWGDGSSSPGTIGGPTGGPFSVSGTHTFAEEGAYAVTAYISDADNAALRTTATSTINVVDDGLSASCAAPANSPTSFKAAVATFTDADPMGTASDYAATIAWGDGSSSPGVVSGPDGGPFIVSAAHTYRPTGKFNITTTIKDAGGSRTSASCRSLIYGFPAGAGAFAFGGKDTAIGSTLAFSVVPWSKLDSLRDDSSPASLKEFLQKWAPTCGVDWAAITGNTSPPVWGPLPDYLGVIAISPVRHSGSTNSAITAHLVIVRTNANYERNPGEGRDLGDGRDSGERRDAGRGTVEAQVC